MNVSANPTTPEKKALRAELLERRKHFSANQQQAASHHIVRQLLEYLDTHKPENLLLYRSLPYEVDTTELFGSAPHSIYSPVTNQRADMHWRKITATTTWATGHLGVLEPSEGMEWSIDTPGHTILICPLVGFDRRGHRLGMGLGCFDRWLHQFRQHLDRVIGLGFACQEYPALPHEAHDIPLDVIITESEVIECRNS